MTNPTKEKKIKELSHDINISSYKLRKSDGGIDVSRTLLPCTVDPEHSSDSPRNMHLKKAPSFWSNRIHGYTSESESLTRRLMFSEY